MADVVVPQGGVVVILRRMEALKRAIDQGDRHQVEFSYDQVLSAIEKHFGVRQR